MNILSMQKHKFTQNAIRKIFKNNNSVEIIKILILLIQRVKFDHERLP
jgi:hypothetical protein